MKRVIVVLLSLHVSLLLVFVYLAWSPPASPKKLKTIPTRATKAQVIEILDEPSRRYNGDRDWAYARFFCESIVYVSFDHRETYVSHVCER